MKVIEEIINKKIEFEFNGKNYLLKYSWYSNIGGNVKILEAFGNGAFIETKTEKEEKRITKEAIKFFNLKI